MHIGIALLLLVAAMGAGVYAQKSHQLARDQVYLAQHSKTVEAITAALDRAAKSSSHPVGVTLPDLSSINTASITETLDGWGRAVQLCTNPTDDTLPALLVISAGADNNFDTGCSQALAGDLNGDDVTRSLRHEQVFARQALEAPETELIANYTVPCSASFDLLEKPTTSAFECHNLCEAFAEFSARYGFHDVQPDWSTCRTTP